MAVTYKVILKKSDEGYAVGCPMLPGCWSQGSTETEALENIREAISEYLLVSREPVEKMDFQELEVTV